MWASPERTQVWVIVRSTEPVGTLAGQENYRHLKLQLALRRRRISLARCSQELEQPPRSRHWLRGAKGGGWT